MTPNPDGYWDFGEGGQLWAEARFGDLRELTLLRRRKK